MAGHININQLDGENPFKEDFKKAVDHIIFISVDSHLNKAIVNGVTVDKITDEGITISSLPAEKYIYENYSDGDMAFCVSGYPLNDDWEGAIIEVHIKKRSSEIFLVM